MFTVFTKDNCTYCDQAKALLSAKGIPFEVKKLGEDFTKEDLLAIVPTARAFPQILKDGTPVGGFMELRATLQ